MIFIYLFLTSSAIFIFTGGFQIPFNYWVDDALILFLKPTLLILTLLAIILIKVQTYKKQIEQYILPLFATISIFLYFNFFHFHFESFLHRHDFFHYYVGSKYFPQFEYQNLYNCIVKAHSQTDTPLSGQIREFPQRTLTKISSETINRCDQLNIPLEKWGDFKLIISWLKNELPLAKYERLLTDYGVNSPPLWITIAGSIANLFNNTYENFTLLAWIDTALLSFGFLAIAYCFGRTTCLLSIILFCCSSFSSLRWIGMSYLRYDWLVCLMVSVCLLKKYPDKFYGWIMLVFASLIRIFPAVLFFNKNLLSLIKNIKFLFYSAILITTSVIASFWYGFDLQDYLDYANNLFSHATTGANNLLGISAISQNNILVYFTVLLLLVFNYYRVDKNLLSKYQQLLLALCLLIIIPLSNYYYCLICLWALWYNSNPRIVELAIVISFLGWITPDDGTNYQYTTYWWSTLLAILAFSTILLLPNVKNNLSTQK